MLPHLSNPIYRDEEAARAYIEALRWPTGPLCPHCGALDDATPMKGKSTRDGVWKCRTCRKPFSVTVGTEFARTRIPLSKLLLASYLLSSARRTSVRQLHLRLGINYRSALLMTRRMRVARSMSGLLADR